MPSLANDKTISSLALHLKQSGYSITEPRQAVFDQLQAHGRLTMTKLCALLKDTVDRTTVYRIVALFESLNIVQKVTHGWKYTLELTDEFIPHHHHFSCMKCGSVISFDEPKLLDDMLSSVAKTNGFAITGHTLEITGLCSACM